MTIVFVLVYGLIILAVLDCVIMWRRLKKLIIAKFGSSPAGGGMYAALRVFQMRRTRMPRPQVARGAYPS